MEFTAYLAFLTIAVGIIYGISFGLFRAMDFSLWVTVLIGAAGGGLAVLGIWEAAIVLFCITGFGILNRLRIRRKLYNWLLILGAVVFLTLFLRVYLPHVTVYWWRIHIFMSRLTADVPQTRKWGVMEIYEIVQFFRYLYPFVLFGTLYLSSWAQRKRKSYPVTTWYRYMGGFDHRIAWLSVPFLVVSGILWLVHGPEWLRLGLLNVGLVLALPHAVYGWLGVAYFAGRGRISPRIVLVAIYAVLLISGPFFLFVVSVLFCIGIADIWIGYFRKRKNNPVS